jgi:hypothetical protein
MFSGQSNNGPSQEHGISWKTAVFSGGLLREDDQQFLKLEKELYQSMPRTFQKSLIWRPSVPFPLIN